MVGSNVLVNILKPVNIVNLGNTLRCGVEIFWSCNSFSKDNRRGYRAAHRPTPFL